ncbi:MAG: gluconate 2-dehydrogenase subunit 3 family protein [Pedobacter sp.]|nr:MAG: gluconate 2-dehydrogenase subunit 3 family protein [Pedobacter sp.]
MDRRQAVKNMAIFIGGALSASTLSVFLDGCTPAEKKPEGLFTASQIDLLNELAETILPATAKSPGAKAAQVGPFMAMMLEDCFPEEVQKVFLAGLEDLEKRSEAKFKSSFISLSPADRTQLLEEVREATIAQQKADGEADKAKAANEPDTSPKQPVKPAAIKDERTARAYFFSTARDLTILGFFTSEIGQTQAYEFIELPGKYEGCVDLKPGQRLRT